MPVSPVLSFDRASLAFGADDVALADLSFDLKPGEWTFVLGPPGSGKTLLLRLAADALQPTAGHIARAGAAALILQTTPLDDAQSARAIVAQSAGGDGAAAARLLTDLGLEAYLDHEPFRLSRGHAKRLAIAQALAARPALLCLDDPFSPLDRAARRRAAAVLRAAARDSGLAILMVSNDPLDALAYADKIVVLGPGPAARVAAVHEQAPRPDADAGTLAAVPLYEELDAALWAQAA